MKQLMPAEFIEQRIFLLRGQKVMLSHHIAALYGVATRTLIQAVKRNRERFPKDFMFQLEWEEAERLKPVDRNFVRSQIVILKKSQHIKYLPHAFTEQGVAMLSSVLRSRRAVQVNIEIMRAFVRLREILASHKDLARKLAVLESKYDAQFRVVFDAIRKLMEPPVKPRRPIGFHTL